jgi:N-sulfoglucosamine sulfohydrolase
LAFGAAILLGGGLGAGGQTNATKVATKPGAGEPNILLITGDDLGLQLGCYGDHTIATPNVDRLAAQGVRFEAAYVTQSSCSSSRSSIFTGLYPHQNGQIGLGHRGFTMDRAWPTIPALLKQAGYRTGHLGKVHVMPNAAFKWDFERPGTRDIQQVRKDFVAFLDQGKGPFFLKLSFIDPHDDIPDQVVGVPANPLAHDAVKDFPWSPGGRSESKRTPASFYNSIKRMDEALGLVLKALDDSGQADNTLVIFLGDTGPPFPRGKQSCYEAGLIEPLVIRWPGHAKAGLVRGEFVSTVDFLPTVLAAAGVPMPKVTAELTEGRSLLPLLEDKSAPEWRKTLFGEMNFHTPSTFRPMRSVREGHFKLIQNLLPTAKVPAIEFFDLTTDPYEFKNLAEAGKVANIKERMLQELMNWRRKTGDPLLNPATLKEWSGIPAHLDRPTGTYVVDPAIKSASKTR